MRKGSIYHETVEKLNADLAKRGKPPVKKTVDPTLKPGEKIVDDPGVPAMSTSVTRDVYAQDGKLLYHDTWYSSYRAEPKLVRIGPKAEKKPAKPTETETTQTTTQPTQ